MAALYPMDTPERVIKRMQQLEDVELPSLPSFQHDIDYESGSNMSGETSVDEQDNGNDSEANLATPHPLRQTAFPPSSASTAQNNSLRSASSGTTSSSSPFPPLPSSSYELNQTPHAYAQPTVALTSTPFSEAKSRSTTTMIRDNDTRSTWKTASRHERTRSGGSSTNGTGIGGRERWMTPGEMSRSFEGDEIPPPPTEGAQEGKSVGEAFMPEEESSMDSFDIAPSHAPSETPLTRRLTTSNVVLQRRAKRSTSNQYQTALLPAHENFSLPSPEERGARPSALGVPDQERIPSLSRSEVSGTDTSGGASTPEGPARVVGVATPRSEMGDDRYDMQSEQDHQEWHGDVQEGHTATSEYHNQDRTFERTRGEDTHDQAPSMNYASPAKTAFSPRRNAPSSSNPFTPGVRNNASFSTAPAASPAQSVPLNDITSTQQNVTPRHLPFTPSPLGTVSKLSDASTPRAPLDDRERRKSHVLAVLSSSGMPTRTFRSTAVRGTPHPLRRAVSASVTQGGSTPMSGMSLATPGGPSQLATNADHTQNGSMASENETFLSIASSADLTSDRRASRLAHPGLPSTRGNTSFPMILLPSSNTTHGSLKGLSGADGRADGIKIHKHLNAMNKQLLEANADLAREAEAWRDEVGRLMGLLTDAGVGFEERDVVSLAQSPYAQEGLTALPERLVGRRAKDSIGVASSTGAGAARDEMWRERLEKGFEKSDLLASQLSQLGTRRRSPTPGATSGMAADDDGNGMADEEILREMAERLKALEQGMDEKDQIIADLEARLANNSTTADGNEELHLKLEEAERARNELQREFATKTAEHTARFAEICQDFETQVRSLEGNLAVAKADAERVRGEKARLEELSGRDGEGEREEELRKQVRGLEVEIRRKGEEVRVRGDEIERLKGLVEKGREVEVKAVRAEEEAQRLRAEVERQQEVSARDRKAKEELESEMDEARKGLGRLTGLLDEMGQSDVDALVHYVEEQKLGRRKAEDILVVREDEVDELKAQLDEREREVQGLEEEVEVLRQAQLDHERARAELEDQVRRRRSSTPRQQEGDLEDSTAPPPDLVEALEDRLADAHREIGRLKHALADTPHRNKSIEVRDARIKALEREKSALTDRLAAIRANGGSLSLSANGNATSTSSLQAAESPFYKKGVPPMSGGMALNRKIASLKTPKTPGPLKDLSWLQTTIGDSDEPVLLAQLEHLERELESANDQLDANFSRLEAAGMSGVKLAEQLAAAKERIGELEDEVRALAQRNRASLALVSEGRKVQGRDAEDRLKHALEAVHVQMGDLKSDMQSERERLQREKSRLRDQVSELRLKSEKEVESFRAEVERLEGEVAEAERARAVATKERDSLRKEVQASSAKIRQLERDLADQRAAYDEVSLRTRREAQGTAASVQAELVAVQEKVRALQSDLRIAQDDTARLRASVREKDARLQQAESRVQAMRDERARLGVELSEFERDLRDAKEQSRKFGEQLRVFSESQGRDDSKDKVVKRLEKEVDELEGEMRRGERRLRELEGKLDEAERWKRDHDCEAGSSLAMSEQKARFKAQSRDLATQIRYLKAKFTREATFRNGLALQKRYLLLLVGGMSLTEQATLKQIASMGFPIPAPPRPPRTLKAVATAVQSLIRARRAAQRWREEREMKAEAVSSRRVSARD